MLPLMRVRTLAQGISTSAHKKLSTDPLQLAEAENKRTEKKRKEKKRKEKKRNENKRKEKKRKEKTTPFGVNLKRSQVLYRAAQGADEMYTA